MIMSVPAWLSYDLSPLVWTFLAVAFCAMVTLMAVCASRIHTVLSKAAADNASLAEETLSDEPSECPPVSVVIYACGSSRTLPAITEAILAQDYPSDFEIIVVNDGADPDVHDAVRRLIPDHPNLHLTFVPEESRNLSRRKLSLTLGIKAAHYDAVVLTRANCMINSPLWLRAMMRHIASGYDIVVGHAVTRVSHSGTDSHRLLRAFDETWQALTYLPRAIAGRPFRATGCNLAYARQLFFDHKGFSQSLHIKGGDDDIFIHQIAEGHPATAELSPASMITVFDDYPSQAHFSLMKERLFADSRLPKAPALIMATCSASLWTWLITAAAAAFIALPSLLPAILMGVMMIPLIIITMRWRKAMMTLSGVKAAWSIPFMALWHPFYHLRHKLAAYRHRNDNFTWN